MCETVASSIVPTFYFSFYSPAIQVRVCFFLSDEEVRPLNGDSSFNLFLIVDAHQYCY
jgi:hypothetical protein